MHYAGQQDIANIGTIGSDQTAASGPVQVKETEAPEAIEPLEKERRRADALEHGLAELRRAMEGRDLRAAATTAAQSEKTDGEKVAELMQDLAAARQELMANEVQYRGGARRGTRSQRRSSKRTGDGAAECRGPGGAIEQNGERGRATQVGGRYRDLRTAAGARAGRSASKRAG